MGCDVIDRIVDRSRKEARQEGREEGREEGIDEMALLIEKLVDQNRFEDVKKVSKDKEYRMQLLKQFALI